jgi:hypothetical protein
MHLNLKLGEGHKFITHLDSPGPGSYHPEYFENSQVLKRFKQRNYMLIKHAHLDQQLKDSESIVQNQTLYRLLEVMN